MVALLSVVFGFALVAAPEASAAVTLNVSTTADIAANAGDCGNASTTVPSPLSLREATCIANNYGSTQPVVINIPAGTYTLSSGELQLGKVTGSTITLVGGGSGSTIIDGNHASRVLDLDPSIVGGVTDSIDGLTIANGRDGTFGGAGIIAGSGNGTMLDSLTITNSVLSNNQANFAVPAAMNKPGGGLLFQGGDLMLNNVTVSGNESFSSAGSGVFYEAAGTAPGQTLTVAGSTFSGNSTANSGASGTSGGALAVSAGAGGGTYTVTNSTFTGNTATSSGNETAVGAAIFEQTGNLTVTGSTFTANAVSNDVSSLGGGSILYTAGTAALHYDRFVNNTVNNGTAAGVMTNSGSGNVDATEDWWGCSAGPNASGCETTFGTAITTSPHLVLTATASPSHVVGPNGTATLTASLLTDSTGGAVNPSNLSPAFDGLPVSFSDPPGDATVTLTAGAHSVHLSSGVASIDYHSNTTLGPDDDLVTLDNGTVTATLEVDEPPSITSPNAAAFRSGTAGSFTITTTGYPNPAVTGAGSLPSGLTFHDNGDGSATVSGTPGAGTGGSYSLSLTASNGTAPDATQTLTVQVGQPPAFTTPATASFVIGFAGSFDITTSGVPAVSAVTESGTLPAGLTFTDNGNGTATIAGTPTGAGNTYPVTLTATNGLNPDATQNLTIQVNQAPSVTLNPADQTVSPGDSVSFTTTASGVPTPTVQWQLSTDGGASFSNVAGATSTTYTFTATAGDDGNQYRAVFSNGVGSPATTTAATLSVGVAPSFTSTDHTSFVVGSADRFTITTSGVPDATVSGSGAQFPGWLTLTDNGDGTGSLTGTPPAGSAGTYQFTLKAANGFSPSASQAFTLFVDDSPVITSSDHTQFTAGQAGSFAITTTPGFPTTTSLTETGVLPAGVTFTDDGSGTATLSGTPAAGSGGSYPITVTATAVGGLATPARQPFTLTVQEPPKITSAEHTTFAVGSDGTFTVSTAGGTPPLTTITESGSLPAGVTFTDNGDGTATLAGTPARGAGGSYPLTLTASNGVLPEATQSFTLSVTELPMITSTDHTTFAAGSAGTFTVTTTAGFPASSTLTETGPLPAGVRFTDDGDGTATLAGTPTGGTGGSYPVTITATNTAGHTEQAFTLSISDPPAITSGDTTSFTVGTPGSFTVTTAPGTPAATTVTESGSLPSGVTFTDNGDGTGTLAGTAAAGTSGNYPITLRASNSTGHVEVAFTLTVTLQPQVVTFTSTPPDPGVVGQDYEVSATGGGSRQPIAFSIDSASTSVCSASGAHITFRHPGVCTILAHQAGDGTYAEATAPQSTTVTPALTTTTLQVQAHTLTATVAAVAPGAGSPTGKVTFTVAGSPVGTAPLAGGTATLNYTVPTGAARTVAAAYGGDADYLASSASVTRHDPSITATLSSTARESSHRWWHTPVKVTFHCQTSGAPLTAPCPRPVLLSRNGAGQALSRTITSVDGGVATARVAGINIDRRAPVVRLAGVRRHGFYRGHAPTPRCVAKDLLSGVLRCTVSTREHGDRAITTARARDRAGNIAKTTVRYTVAHYYIAGARHRHGVYQVRRGRWYQIVAITAGRARPHFYDAAPAGVRPGPVDGRFRRAGTVDGHPRWVLVWHIDHNLSSYPVWNIGVRADEKLHRIPFHQI